MTTSKYLTKYFCRRSLQHTFSKKIRCLFEVESPMCGCTVSIHYCSSFLFIGFEISFFTVSHWHSSLLDQPHAWRDGIHITIPLNFDFPSWNFKVDEDWYVPTARVRSNLRKALHPSSFMKSPTDKCNALNGNCIASRRRNQSHETQIVSYQLLIFSDRFEFSPQISWSRIGMVKK